MTSSRTLFLLLAPTDASVDLKGTAKRGKGGSLYIVPLVRVTRAIHFTRTGTQMATGEKHPDADRHTYTHTHTQRQAERQTDRQTDRHTHILTLHVRHAGHVLHGQAAAGEEAAQATAAYSCQGAARVCSEPGQRHHSLALEADMQTRCWHWQEGV